MNTRLDSVSIEDQLPQEFFELSEETQGVIRGQIADLLSIKDNDNAIIPGKELYEFAKNTYPILDDRIKFWAILLG